MPRASGTRQKQPPGQRTTETCKHQRGDHIVAIASRVGQSPPTTRLIDAVTEMFGELAGDWTDPRPAGRHGSSPRRCGLAACADARCRRCRGGESTQCNRDGMDCCSHAIHPLLDKRCNRYALSIHMNASATICAESRQHRCAVRESASRNARTGSNTPCPAPEPRPCRRYATPTRPSTSAGCRHRFRFRCPSSAVRSGENPARCE